MLGPLADTAARRLPRWITLDPYSRTGSTAGRADVTAATGFMTIPPSTHEARPSRGVVAVITRQDAFLVIRRSQYVRAPGAYCFPGGGVESGESPQEALRRELHEELAAEARINRCLWNNVTRSGVQLGWWRAELEPESQLVANPAEVESIHWLSADSLRQLPHLLSTNVDFLNALDRRDFSL